MKLEEQVCSLDLAKRLKELGVTQESAFYWMHDPYGDWTLVRRLKDETSDMPFYSAFSGVELFDALDRTGVWAEATEEGYRVGSDLSPEFMDLKLADAMAELQIHLIEQGIVKP